MSTLEEAYEHTEAYYDTDRNKPYMATKSTMPKGGKPLYADSAPSNIMKENDRNAEKTVLLYGKYNKQQLLEYVALLGGTEDESTPTTVQCESTQEPEQEKQLVVKATVSQQPKG